MEREKVIKELEECIEHIRINEFEKIPCWGNCQIAMMDALGQLKEQEPQHVKVVKNAYNHEFYYCPKCDRSFYNLLFEKPKFCDKCGQEITWNGSD